MRHPDYINPSQSSPFRPSDPFFFYLTFPLLITATMLGQRRNADLPADGTAAAHRKSMLRARGRLNWDNNPAQRGPKQLALKNRTSLF